MSYFLTVLIEADAKIKLRERESSVMAEVDQERVRESSGERLVEIQLERTETKIENIQERIRETQDEALIAIDEAMLEAAKAEQEELKEWLKTR